MTPIQWTYDLCLLQGTGPLIFPSVLEKSDLPPHDRNAMKQVCMHSIQTQILQSQILTRAWTALEQAGIKPVLMKGFGLAQYYPSMEQRLCGDIDIFVGKEQYHPACAAMRKEFPDALRFDEELDHYKHYNLIADGVSIEIHRISVGLQHPLDVHRYNRIERRGMALENCETMEWGGLTLRTPEPTFNALFVMLHSWEHFITSGVNMRQLYDLKFLLEHVADRVNKTLLEHDLEALSLTDVWQLYMYILVNALGMERSCAVLYTDACENRAEAMLDAILYSRRNNNATADKAPRNRILRKIYTMNSRMADAKSIEPFSPDYARHMRITTMLHGAQRFFAKDRRWE